MKKFVKLFASVAVIGSMIFSMTGCVVTDAKNAATDIMDNVFNFKASKVEKYMDEDDKEFDEQCELLEDLFDGLQEELDVGFEDMHSTNFNVSVKNNDAKIVLTYPIEEGKYEIELNLVKDGEDWIIADNEEFIVSITNFIFEVVNEEGSKSQKKYIDAMLDELDISKVSKIGQALYDEMI